MRSRTARLEDASAEEHERFQRAVRLGVEVRRRLQRGEEMPEAMQRAYEQADVEVFKGVRDLFGGRVRQAVSGAAPIAPSILEFFYVAGVPVLEGWGMTEATAVGTVNTLAARASAQWAGRCRASKSNLPG